MEANSKMLLKPGPESVCGTSIHANCEDLAEQHELIIKTEIALRKTVDMPPYNKIF